MLGISAEYLELRLVLRAYFGRDSSDHSIDGYRMYSQGQYTGIVLVLPSESFCDFPDYSIDGLRTYSHGNYTGIVLDLPCVLMRGARDPFLD